MAWILGLVLTSVVCASCGGAQRGGVMMRPLEERRARAIIERAVRDSGAEPARPRVVVEAGTGKEITEELAIAGGKYGIAYVTKAEQDALGDAIPPYNPDKAKLTVVRGKDGEAVAVFYQQAYEYDAGPEHTTTIATVEGKLRRNVSDYVLHVVEPDKIR